MVAAVGNFDFLESRGLENVAGEVGWQRTPYGYKVPTYDGAPPAYVFYYNADASTRQRFGKVNLARKPENVRWYVLPDLAAAVAAAGGVLYLASGITDMLSFVASDMRNVAAPLGGELALPVRLVDDLRAWGVSRVVYLPDNDQTGYKSAVKVAGLLDGSGIAIDARRLPDTCKDVNDAWVSLRAFGGAGVFRAMLDAAPPLPLLVERRQPSQPSDRQIKADGLEAVYAALGVSRWKDGKSNPITCPFHDDEKPSAVLFRNEGSLPALHCAVCGTFTIKAVADRVGVSLRWEAPLQVRERCSALPDPLRARMIERGQIRIARFFDVMLANGVALGRSYTAKELECEAFPAKTISNLLGVFARKCRDSFKIQKEKGKCTIPGENMQGRPETRYLLPTVQEIASAYRLPAGAVDGTRIDTSTLRKYRQAAYALHVAQNQDGWARRGYYPSAEKLADQVGITNRTLWRYEGEMPELERRRRLHSERVPSDYQLSDAQRAEGWYLVTLRGGNTYLRKSLSSTRKITLPAPGENGGQATTDQFRSVEGGNDV